MGGEEAKGEMMYMWRFFRVRYRSTGFQGCRIRIWHYSKLWISVLLILWYMTCKNCCMYFIPPLAPIPLSARLWIFQIFKSSKSIYVVKCIPLGCLKVVFNSLKWILNEKKKMKIFDFVARFDLFFGQLPSTIFGPKNRHVWAQREKSYQMTLVSATSLFRWKFIEVLQFWAFAVLENSGIGSTDWCFSYFNPLGTFGL